MRVFAGQIDQSPLLDGHIRLSTRVEYERKNLSPETYWFDLPARVADGVIRVGDPWLACLLPLAMQLHEPLRIDDPIDPLLWENAHEFMEVRRRWHPNLERIAIQADRQSPPESRPKEMKRVGSFFSGGVDSFFSAIRHDDPTSAFPPVSDLITVWGFDVPLDKPEVFGRLRDTLAEAAREMNKTHIAVATNLRETALKRVDWGMVWHGAALASVGLCMESLFDRLLIPSSQPYECLVRWGSSALTDPLFSTTTTRVIYDGAGYSRGDKIEAIAQSNPAMQHLRVCWEKQSDANCAACGKCLRTMILLEATGARSICRTFPAGPPIAEIASTVHLRTPSEITSMEEITPFLMKKGRLDLVKIARKCIARSRRENWQASVWDTMVRSKAARVRHALSKRVARYCHPGKIDASGE